jgi:hypothetical protein
MRPDLEMNEAHMQKIGGELNIQPQSVGWFIPALNKSEGGN